MFSILPRASVLLLYNPLFALLETAAPAPAKPPQPFAVLEVYAGTWTVRALHPFGGGVAGSTDTLTNHCTTGLAFFACEQVVNGQSAALVVFTAASSAPDEPGLFHIGNVLPNGHTGGGTSLTIRGTHWTYLSPGDIQYRNENVFDSPDHIRFTQFESKDAGKTWTETNSGEETRAKP